MIIVKVEGMLKEFVWLRIKTKFRCKCYKAFSYRMFLADSCIL